MAKHIISLIVDVFTIIEIRKLAALDQERRKLFIPNIPAFTTHASSAGKSLGKAHRLLIRMIHNRLITESQESQVLISY